ncbi:ATP-binding protein [Ktedonobacter robiniae]|nr:ATP-binding protein [Ktedonobacter robiniae]
MLETEASPARPIEATLPEEIVATVLQRLWKREFPEEELLLFFGAKYGSLRHHQAFFLNMVVERAAKDEYCLLSIWERFAPPPDAYGIAEAPLSGPLLQANAYDIASIDDRNTVIGPVAGWYRYTFLGGWTAFAVMLPPDQGGDAISLVAIPYGRQDEWLAFLQALKTLSDERRHKNRRGIIDVMSDSKDGSDDIVKVIEHTRFEDVILPESILNEIQMHRSFFRPEILERYASRHLPRKRLVLLAGPPGTGKTTLLKAVATDHAQQGGSVLYMLVKRQRFRASWDLFTQALETAAESQLPTLLVVDDFESICDVENMHELLNVLDGVNTPDNPAGTMILASTNAPNRIDPRIKDRAGRVDAIIEIGPVEQEDLVLRFLRRFLDKDYCEQEHAPVASKLLKQTGSHLQEVCSRAVLLALNDGRDNILGSDLLQAHNAILRGREIAGDAERFAPPPSRRRDMGFNRKEF